MRKLFLILFVLCITLSLALIACDPDNKSGSNNCEGDCGCTDNDCGKTGCGCEDGTIPGGNNCEGDCGCTDNDCGKTNCECGDGSNGNEYTGLLTEKDYRTANALLKLKNGGNITFAAIGGSITQGGCVNGVNQWLQAKAAASGGSVTYVNAGIGASDSAFGLLRLQDHVLRRNPDIIVVEYSVNDGYYFDSALYHKTYESIVRQSLKGSDRAVYLLLMHTDAQGNANNNPTHTPYTNIGNNYDLPVFKWRDYGNPPTGNWVTSDFYTDGTHLTPAGNASVAQGIIDYLEEVWDNLPAAQFCMNRILPAPQFSGDYTNTVLITWGGTGITTGGWTQYNGLPGNWTSLSSTGAGGISNIRGFQTTQGNNELRIRFTGKSVYVVSSYRGSPFTGHPGAASWGNASSHATARVIRPNNTNTTNRFIGSLSYWNVPEWFGTQIADGLDATQEHTLVIKAASGGSTNVIGVIVGVNP